ncbi:MAG: hypothetical protein QXJ49_06985, partial [Nitrososphaerota archaeon]
MKVNDWVASTSASRASNLAKRVERKYVEIDPRHQLHRISRRELKEFEERIRTLVNERVNLA